MPARSPTAHTARHAPALALALAAALAAAGCGSGSGEEESAAITGGLDAGDRPEGVIDISGTEPVGEELAGSVAPLVTCLDWNGADPSQKLATIADVRSQINTLDSGIDAPALTDEEAGDLFDYACEPSWAGGFRLYKLYARGAGFVTLERELRTEP